jgi:hypothetical protein
VPNDDLFSNHQKRQRQYAALVERGMSMAFTPPSIRQIPFKYHTLEHGPVYAYKAVGDRAECVTWLDVTCQVEHNKLLPFDPKAEGAELISDLEWDVMEAASPHPYVPASRKSRIGAYIFEMPHIWNSIIGA